MSPTSPLNLQPRHGTCLAGCGKRLESLRATYHRLGGVRHFFAAYNLETDRLFGVFAKSKDGIEYLRFLKWLRRRYRPQEVLHIVLDNYNTHIGSEVLAWAKRHNLRFYFTPTNASWVNRIECELTSLRKFTLANSDYATHEEMQHVIELYPSWRNRARNIAIAPWKSYRRGRQAA